MQVDGGYTGGEMVRGGHRFDGGVGRITSAPPTKEVMVVLYHFWLEFSVEFSHSLVVVPRLLEKRLCAPV